MRGIRTLGVVLAIGTTLVSGALPAGAHLSAYTGPVPPVYPIPPGRASGAVLAKVAVSPDLPVFPCGTAAAALDAITLYATTPPNPDWDSDRYDPCYGDLYSAAEGAVNAGFTGGAGFDHTAGLPFAWQSTAPGAVTANYTYSEPCQSVGGSPPEAVTGEAIGWIRVVGPAAGSHGTTPVTSADVRIKFWWSRVGLNAVIGLDDPVIDLNGALPPAPVAITKFVGNGDAVFIPTVLPSCAAPTHTHPNDILIAAQAEGAGDGTIK